MALPLPLAAWATVLICGLLVVEWLFRRVRGHGLVGRASLPLPPGPPPLPVVGNVRDVPQSHFGPGYLKLSEKYGDIVHLKILDKSLVVLGSHKAVANVLEKQSALTADRPQSTMVKLGGWDCFFVTMGNGPELRRHRRGFHQSFSPDIIPKYQGLQRDALNTFLQNLQRTPEQFLEHVDLVVSQNIVRVTYGIKVESRENEHVKLFQKVATSGDAIMAPGRFLVEVFPVLRHVPAWLPGARFKRLALALKQDSEAMKNALFAAAQRAVDDGTGRDSVIAQWLVDAESLSGAVAEEQHEFFKSLAGTMYLGGADNMNVAILTFMLAMLVSPEVQRRAQAELDAVIGTHRLPDFTDRASLPYVEAVFKEVLRWNVVVPLGVPHCASEEIEYEGYRIPKGAVISWNAWAFSRDPVDYPDPERFNPDRFLKNGQIDRDVRDPVSYAFGYGRRVCPGRHFAESFLFTLMASVLHVFTISAPLDENGRPMHVEPRFSSDRMLSQQPEEFQCTIKPRSERAEALVLATKF